MVKQGFYWRTVTIGEEFNPFRVVSVLPLPPLPPLCVCACVYFKLNHNDVVVKIYILYVTLDIILKYYNTQ